MLRKLFRKSLPLARSVEQEVLSICRGAQIESIGLNRHLRRDVGLDCGCASTPHSRL